MSSDFSIEDLPLVEAVGKFREPWEAWVVEHRLNISHLPDWVLCAASGLAVQDEVMVSIAHGPAGPAGFLPWRLRRRTFGGVPYVAVETGACLPAYHPDWLCGDAGPPLLRHLRNRMPSLGAHAVSFTNVPVKGTSDTLVRRSDLFACRHDAAGDVSPIIRLPDGWETYLGKRTGKFRNTLKRKLRKFNDQADTCIKSFETVDGVSELLEHMLEIEAESWKMPAGIAIERGGPEHHYYQSILPWLASNGMMVGFVLKKGNDPVAYALRYLWQGEMGGMKATYKSQYGWLSPGTILQEQCLHYAFDKGLRLFDFLGDTGRHKEEWANDAIEHCSHLCFATSWRYRLGRAARRAGGVLKGMRARRRTAAA